MARPVADNLFTQEGGRLRLLAGRSKDSGRLRFPYPQGAEADRFELVELSPRGTLWSYTVQRFMPKTPYDGATDPDEFKPYAVGYVELPGELIVESRIVADSFEDLEIGQPMEIVTEAYRQDADGEPVLTYAFSPAEQGAAS